MSRSAVCDAGTDQHAAQSPLLNKAFNIKIFMPGEKEERENSVWYAVVWKIRKILIKKDFQVPMWKVFRKKKILFCLWWRGVLCKVAKEKHLPRSCIVNKYGDRNNRRTEQWRWSQTKSRRGNCPQSSDLLKINILTKFLEVCRKRIYLLVTLHRNSIRVLPSPTQHQ